MTPPPEDADAATLFDRPAHEILLVLGGFLAILLAAIFLGVAVLAEDANQRADTFIRGLTNYAVVDVVLGFLLLVSLTIMSRSSRTTGALLALVSSIVLVVLGGTAGIVGGLFGVVGAMIALLPAYKNLLP